ncbi:hypothetical protein ACJIZ3_009993 [Penstemon smallii]|uniref:Calcineurin-like phosphoesterase domain-containing protein n=1 Tax=Penstemon smallii TaxID=265156 RepID=A0ABD3TEN4_9LAMI
MIGNHCLYNVPRENLLPLLNIHSSDKLAYYDFSPIPEYRFILLDGYDINSIGWPKDHPTTLKTLHFLEERNPNLDKNSLNGLVGLERRFLMFNGADATKLNQKVVLCCHLPLDPNESSIESLLWNYDEVMNVVHRYNCVKVCLSGHAHKALC